MNTTPKILLGISALCYVLALCGIILSHPWVTLIAFILHSMLLIGFAYSIWLLWQKSLSAPARDPKVSEEESLSEKLSQTESRNHELTLENTRLSQALTEALAEAQAACDELRKPSKTSEYEHLLPAPDPNGTETINIIQVARDVMQELLPFSRKAGIQIQISAVTDTLLVKADKNRIRILFRNIIDNSIKYMNRSGNLTITMSSLGDDIFIVLKDNGNGLDESETPHVFELNYQGSNRISGNGLGLTQAMAIVHSYGGTIYARSTLGKGMGIYIQIPIE